MRRPIGGVRSMTARPDTSLNDWLNTIFTFNLCHPNAKTGIPTLVTKSLGRLMLCVPFPVTDGFEAFPVRNCYPQIFPDGLDTQKPRLLRCQFKHSFCHGGVTAVTRGAIATEDHSVVGWLWSLGKFRHGSPGYLALECCCRQNAARIGGRSQRTAMPAYVAHHCHTSSASTAGSS